MVMNRRASDNILIEMSGTIGKMAGTMESIHEKVEKIDEKFDHHEDRISDLEDSKNMIIWGAAGFSAAISGVVAIFSWFLK